MSSKQEQHHEQQQQQKQQQPPSALGRDGLQGAGFKAGVEGEALEAKKGATLFKKLRDAANQQTKDEQLKDIESTVHTTLVCTVGSMAARAWDIDTEIDTIGDEVMEQIGRESCTAATTTSNKTPDGKLCEASSKSAALVGIGGRALNRVVEARQQRCLALGVTMRRVHDQAGRPAMHASRKKVQNAVTLHGCEKIRQYCKKIIRALKTYNRSEFKTHKNCETMNPSWVREKLDVPTGISEDDAKELVRVVRTLSFACLGATRAAYSICPHRAALYVVARATILGRIGDVVGAWAAIGCGPCTTFINIALAMRNVHTWVEIANEVKKVIIKLMESRQVRDVQLAVTLSEIAASSAQLACGAGACESDGEILKQLGSLDGEKEDGWSGAILPIGVKRPPPPKDEEGDGCLLFRATIGIKVPGETRWDKKRKKEVAKYETLHLGSYISPNSASQAYYAALAMHNSLTLSEIQTIQENEKKFSSRNRNAASSFVQDQLRLIKKKRAAEDDIITVHEDAK